MSAVAKKLKELRMQQDPRVKARLREIKVGLIPTFIVVKDAPREVEDSGRVKMGDGN